MSSGSLELSAPLHGIGTYLGTPLNSVPIVLTGVLSTTRHRQVKQQSKHRPHRLKPPSPALLRGPAWSVHPEATHDPSRFFSLF